MKTSSVKILLICLCGLPWLNNGNLLAQIWGNPGSSVNIPCQTPGCNYNWAINTCSSDLTINGATNMGVLNVNIAGNTSCCSANIVATAGDDCNGNTTPSCSGALNMIPTLSAPAQVFAGTSFNVNVKSGGSNGLNCATTHGCSGANVTGWNVSGANCQNPCSGNVITVNVPNNPSVTSPILISANYNCNGSKPISQIAVNVVLQNPSISGSPQSIGCGSNPVIINSNQVTYNASSVVGAGFWVWSWPSNMSPIGNTNSQSITLNINSTGSGNVSVQAFNSNGGSVKSAIVNLPVNICCIPVINENTILNSGNTGYLVEALSTINSINDIQSTGTATMHAGAEVRLFPGFNAASGAQIHLYPASCGTGYYRFAGSQYTSNPTKFEDDTTSLSNTGAPSILNYTMTPKDSGQKSLSSLPYSTVEDLFSIFPNPTTGKVRILFTSEFDQLAEITVMDALGNTIHRDNNLQSDHKTIDLSTYANGMYAIRVFYNDKIQCKLLMKNE